jgi:hypothetical protein
MNTTSLYQGGELTLNSLWLADLNMDFYICNYTVLMNMRCEFRFKLPVKAGHGPDEVVIVQFKEDVITYSANFLIYITNMRTHKFTRLKNPKYRVFHPAIGFLNWQEGNKTLVLAGGLDRNGKPTRMTTILHLDEEIWNKGHDLPYDIAYAKTYQYQDSFMMYGLGTTDIVFFDQKAKKWNILRNKLKTPRQNGVVIFFPSDELCY